MLQDNPQDFIDRLRTDLLKARKARDRLTTTTLQEVLSAIDNAGAIPVPEDIATVGTGSTEAMRRELSTQDIHDLVKHEITEAQHAIKKLGDKENSYVNELDKRIAILEGYLLA
jgi:uncharacterized protein YqeY